MNEEKKPAKTPLTEEEKEEIRKQYKAGAKWADLRKKHSDYFILKALKGVKRRRKPRKGTKPALRLEKRLAKKLDPNKAIQMANQDDRSRQAILRGCKARLEQLNPNVAKVEIYFPSNEAIVYYMTKETFKL